MKFLVVIDKEHGGTSVKGLYSTRAVALEEITKYVDIHTKEDQESTLEEYYLEKWEMVDNDGTSTVYATNRYKDLLRICPIIVDVSFNN